MINLNKNYRIVFDENNTVLQFFELREKPNKETEEKPNLNTQKTTTIQMLKQH